MAHLASIAASCSEAADSVQACYGHTSKSKGSAFLWFEQQQHAIIAILAMHGQLCLPRRHGAPARPLTVRPALHSRKQAPRAPLTAMTFVTPPGAHLAGGAAGGGAMAGPMYPAPGMYAQDYAARRGTMDPIAGSAHNAALGGAYAADTYPPGAQQPAPYFGDAPPPVYGAGGAPVDTHAAGGGSGAGGGGARAAEDYRGMVDQLQTMRLGGGDGSSGGGGSGYQGSAAHSHQHSAQHPASFNTLAAAPYGDGAGPSQSFATPQPPMLENQLEQLRAMVAQRYATQQHGYDIAYGGSGYRGEGSGGYSSEYAGSHHRLGSQQLSGGGSGSHHGLGSQQFGGYGGSHDRNEAARFEAAQSAHSAALSLLHHGSGSAGSAGTHSQASQSQPIVAHHLQQPGGSATASAPDVRHSAGTSGTTHSVGAATHSAASNIGAGGEGGDGNGGGGMLDPANTSGGSGRASRHARMPLPIPESSAHGAQSPDMQIPWQPLANTSSAQSSLPSMPELHPLSVEHAALPHVGRGAPRHTPHASNASQLSCGYGGGGGSASGHSNDPAHAAAWAVRSAGWSSSSATFSSNATAAPGGARMRSGEYRSGDMYLQVRCSTAINCNVGVLQCGCLCLVAQWRLAAGNLLCGVDAMRRRTGNVSCASV